MGFGHHPIYQRHSGLWIGDVSVQLGSSQCQPARESLVGVAGLNTVRSWNIPAIVINSTSRRVSVTRMVITSFKVPQQLIKADLIDAALDLISPFWRRHVAVETR